MAKTESCRSLKLFCWKIRYGAVALGYDGGFAGAYASTVYTPLWADGMIAGRGWIAVALVVFGTWKTSRIFLGPICRDGDFGGAGRAIFGICCPLPISDCDALWLRLWFWRSFLLMERLRLHAPYSLGETYDGSNHDKPC